MALLDSSGLITVEETVALIVLELCDGFEDPIYGICFNGGSLIKMVVFWFMIFKTVIL
jgi:hypothetical protein